MTILGFTMEQLCDLILHYKSNTAFEQQQLLNENLTLRGKVSFYESHIQQMNDVREPTI